MYLTLKKQLKSSLEQLQAKRLYKHEHVITSAQGAEVTLPDMRVMLNFCSNNYLGLSAHARIRDAVVRSTHTHGAGLSSVRFICGTQNIHKKLEKELSTFLGTEDTILYAAAFDANGGLFEPLFDEKDVICSDALNHASLIDGIRLCKAKRARYPHNNMQALEEILAEHQDARHRVIVSDGVFSMDGRIAQIDKICALARKYKAITVIDDSHATGFIGPTGKGTHEHHAVLGQVDIITGTLGKALGGASGGFVSAGQEVVEMLRQRSRPYLFSNTLAPPVVGGALEALQLIGESSTLREKLLENAAYFRTKVKKMGYNVGAGIHPIVPIMLHDSLLAHKLAENLFEQGIYVVSFAYPVVPEGQARIRVQLSALHTKEHIDSLLFSLEKEGMGLGVI